MKNILIVRTGLGSGFTGSRITLRSTTGIIFAGFVVIGLQLRKLRSITSSPGQRRTCLTLIIFNRHMVYVTITKEVKDGSQK